MTYEEIKKYISRYLKARIPVIIIDTVEKGRAIRLLKEVQKDLNYDFKLFKMSEGIIDIRNNQILSEENTIASTLDFIA